MIYDKELRYGELSPGSSPLDRRLAVKGSHLYGVKTVYSQRFFEALQAGIRIDTMVQIGLPDAIRAGTYVVLADGFTYRVVQSQTQEDVNGLPVTVLSLMKEDEKYELVRA